MPDDCIFCRIVARSEPAAMIRGDERTVAFLALAPATEGHALVVPRRHASDVFEIDDADLEAVAKTAKEVALWQRGRLGCAGVSIYQANGTAGFQTVFHYHVHVVPRYPGDRVVHAWEAEPRSIADLAPVARRLSGGSSAHPGRPRPSHQRGSAP